MLRNVVFPIACARVVVRPGHSTKIEIVLRLVPSLKGEGIIIIIIVIIISDDVSDDINFIWNNFKLDCNDSKFMLIDISVICLLPKWGM